MYPTYSPTTAVTVAAMMRDEAIRHAEQRRAVAEVREARHARDARIARQEARTTTVRRRWPRRRIAPSVSS